jgi:hypothetical protein
LLAEHIQQVPAGSEIPEASRFELQCIYGY